MTQKDDMLSLTYKKMTIANIYGPNTDDPQFFHTFFSSIANLPQSVIIIGGDFNTVIEPTQDESNTPSLFKPWQSTETIKQYMTVLGLKDSWRLTNPNSREIIIQIIFTY